MYAEIGLCGIQQMWPDLIAKSKDGAIDVIETYVFWNGHEPEKRQVINILNLYKVFHVCNVFSDGTVNC